MASASRPICESDNPVVSVYQTDIIYYALDFPSYLATECKVRKPLPLPDSPREIGLWGELVTLSDK